MASIQDYLDLIKNAIYGKDVRQAIHDGIQQCYYDGKAGSTDLEARQRLDSAEGSISSLSSRMSTAENDIDVLDSRVDQIVAPSGEAPSAAEVSDARIGADGTTYTSLGDAVRGQVTDLSESVTTDATLALIGSINSSGVIISASGFGCYKAKVKMGIRYKVTSHDAGGDLVCAFYYNEPAVGEASYNGSRIVSNDLSVVAPIDGWIAFRSAETKTDESITNVVANDYIARSEIEKAYNALDNYRQIHAIIPDKNLYDSSFLVQNGWIRQDGAVQYSPSSYYAVIPVVGNTDIAVCFGIDSLYMDSASIGGFVEYDEEMNLIATQSFGNARRPEDYKYNGSWVGKFTLNSNTCYVSFTAKLSSTWDARTSLIVAYGEDLSNYSGQGDTLLSWDGFKFHSDAKWLDKKWCVVGDSLTAVNATADKKYYSLIQDNTGISVANVAVSGSGYAKKASSNESFVHQVQSIPNDTDVVTVFGSGNDNTAGLQLGSITDSGTTTLCGCVNTVIDYMIANHPTVAFGIITPTPWANWEPSDSLYWMAEYSEAIVKICNRRGVPCLDLYHCSNLHPSDASFNAIAFYNADGTHPNNVGHAIIAPRIEAFLDSLI